jgi:hypothetical protein
MHLSRLNIFALFFAVLALVCPCLANPLVASQDTPEFFNLASENAIGV